MRSKAKLKDVKGERVPLAQVKAQFSRYIRVVQTSGMPITITHHGRDAAALAPLSTAPLSTLATHGPVDPRPLGELKLRPGRGQGATLAALRRALDEDRGE
jgi:prevent-host-death family protein